MQIVIRLPAVYPLEGVKVEGINRVAVDEKKWTSWMMITQAVITFSNGNITDGLVTFHKNVSGALKGHTECAICYSIISSDKKVPDKKCQTCKNLFHSSCLFKWFASSNQSTCPLCRNPFNYGTVRRWGRSNSGGEAVVFKGIVMGISLGEGEGGVVIKGAMGIKIGREEWSERKRRKGRLACIVHMMNTTNSTNTRCI